MYNSYTVEKYEKIKITNPTKDNHYENSCISFQSISFSFFPFCFVFKALKNMFNKSVWRNQHSAQHVVGT